jgi:GDP-D-mannose dehydratase
LKPDQWEERLTTISVKRTPRAFISGITGQDGSYLAEFLLTQGYEVRGIIRRTSTFNTDRLDHIYSDPHEEGTALHLHYGDLANAAHLNRLLKQIEPDEVYNLGAQSHVHVSFDQAEYKRWAALKSSTTPDRTFLMCQVGGEFTLGNPVYGHRCKGVG